MVQLLREVVVVDVDQVAEFVEVVVHIEIALFKLLLDLQDLWALVITK